MTIKKLSKPAPTAPAETPAEPADSVPSAAAGATIADRFKLDMTEQPVKKSGGIGTTIAFLAALAALGVAGLLTFTLYQHWEFLRGA